MALFAESGIYLQSGPRPQGEARPVLWPLRIHRVLYPENRHTQLNVFQRAVLGLIRARVVIPEQLAEMTGLHANLITLILAQSVSSGWIKSSKDALTPRGQRLLDDEDDGVGQLKSGYLLQDAVSGKFWPRLFSTLQQLDPINPLETNPHFILARKTGAVLRPYLISASRSPLPSMEHKALVMAWREYRNDYRASQQLGHSPLSPHIGLQGLQQLEEEPRCARMLVWITSDRESGQLWHVADPFTLRKSAWWLDLLPMVEKDINLQKILAPLIPVPRAEEQSYQQWLETVGQQTDLQILIDYPWVERQPDVKRYLAALLIHKGRIEEGDRDDSALGAALNECQKLLEVVMQWLIRRYPPNAELLPVRQGKRSDTEQLLFSLSIPAFTQKVVQGLSGQHVSQVRNACRNPAGSVKALLFAAALGTHKNPQHPFWTLDDSALQLPILLELADHRNKSSHGQSQYIDKPAHAITPQMVLGSISYTLSFTELFKDWM